MYMAMCMQEIMDHASATAARAYTQARVRQQEAHPAREVAQKQRDDTSRVHSDSAEACTNTAAAGFDREIRAIRTRIIEEVLNLHCPRCKGAFLDFDGCLALQCIRSSCRAAFCGACLHDCGEDAHEHARVCQYAQINGEQTRDWRTDLPVMHRKLRVDRIGEVCKLITHVMPEIPNVAASRRCVCAAQTTPTSPSSVGNKAQPPQLCFAQDA